MVIGFGIAGGCAAVERRGRGRAGAGAREGGRGRRHRVDGRRPLLSRRRHRGAAGDRSRRLAPRRCTSTWSRCRREPEHDKIRAYCDGSVEHFNWLEDLGFQFERSYYPGKVVVPPGTEGLTYTGNEKVWPFFEQAKPAPRGHSVPVPGELGGAAMVIDLLRQAGRRARRADPLRDRRDQPRRRRDGRGGRRRAGSTSPKPARSRRKAVDHRRRRLRDEPRDGRRAHTRAGPETAHQAPRLVAPYILGNPNDDGLGIRLGVSAGGVAENMDQMFITAAAYPPEILLTGIIVNKDGQAVRRRGLLPLAHIGVRAGAARPGGVPDRRRGAHADARDAADPVHRRLGDGRGDGSRARHPGGQPGRHAGPVQRARRRAARIRTSTSSRNTLRPQDNGPWAAFDLSLGRAMYSGLHDGRAGGVHRRRGAARGRQRRRRACTPRARARRTSPRTARATPAAPSWARARSSAAAPARTRPGGARPRRFAAEPPLAVAEQLEPSVVMLLDRAAVADADHDAVRQLGAQQLGTARTPGPRRVPRSPRRGTPPWAWSAAPGRTRCAAARPGRAPWPSRPPRRAGRQVAQRHRVERRVDSARHRTRRLRPDSDTTARRSPSGSTAAGTGTSCRRSVGAAQRARGERPQLRQAAQQRGLARTRSCP